MNNQPVTESIHNLTDSDHQIFYDSLIESLLFTSPDADGYPQTSFAPLDQDYSKIARVITDRFLNQLSEDDYYEAISLNSLSYLAHDLIMTAQCQGCGFWDGDYDSDEFPGLGERLTQAAKNTLSESVSLFYDKDSESCYLEYFSPLKTA